MRFLFLLRSLANVAGTERVMSDKINWLAERGHNIILVTYEQGEHPLSICLHPNVRFADLDIRFFKLSNVPLIRRFLSFNRMKKVFKKRLQTLAEDFNPDLIVVTSYSMKLINEIISLKTNAKKVLESHAVCYTVGKEYDYSSKPIMRQIGRLYDRYNYRQLNKLNMIIALTEGDKCEWNRYSNHVIVLPNPLTHYPDHISRNDNTHRILCVGRLSEQKGFDLMIDAFAIIASQFPAWYVDIYGHGEDENMLRQKINSKGLEGRVNIYSPIENIYEEYNNSAFLVLSSRYESFGLVLIEAMSCGLPIVAFNCKYGPSDIIENGVDGLLAADGDIKDLADKMLWMINHSNERLEFGRKARVSVKRYCKDVVMKKWEQAYLSV